MKRRNFIKQTIVASGIIAIPTIIPTSCTSRKNGKTPPSDRIVMGGIGIGGMGRGDMTNFLRMDDVQYVAICDVDKNQINKALQRIKEEKGNNRDINTYGDFRDFFEKEKLDAVHLALPDHWHAIPSVAAANLGLDIYGQKPVARSIAEGRAIVNAVEKNNIVWQTGSQQRSVEKFLKACEIVRNGKLGKIHRVEVGLPDGGHKAGQPAEQPVPKGVDWDFWLGPAPKVPFRGVLHGKWRWMLDYSGGNLTDWAGHHIDIAQWGLGLEHTGPVEVEGIGKYHENDMFNVPIAWDINYKYENGIELNVANRSKFIRERKGKKGWMREKEPQIGMGAVWYGENGWLQVNRSGIWAENKEILNHEIGSGDIKLYNSPGHYKDFINCVKSRKDPIAPAEVGHRSISVALLGEIAITTGEKLKWNPETEKFTNNDAANAMLMKPYHNSWEIPEV